VPADTEMDRGPSDIRTMNISAGGKICVKNSCEYLLRGSNIHLYIA